MSPKPFEPFGITTFCDDIRYELGGKYSLVGIYRDDLLIQGATFPATLPKLALSITLLFHPALPPMPPLDIKISFPGDDENTPSFGGRFETSIEPVPDAPQDTRRSLNLHFILSPIILKEPGSIKVRLHDQVRIIKAGTLDVRAAEVQENRLLRLANLPPTTGLLTTHKPVT